jgi:hypothetical protein
MNMLTAELDLTTEQTEEAACEELTTTFEALYDAVLQGETGAAGAAADLCEEEGDLACAYALRAFAMPVTLPRFQIEIRRTEENAFWVRTIRGGKECRRDSRHFTHTDPQEAIDAALNFAKRAILRKLEGDNQ